MTSRVRTINSVTPGLNSTVALLSPLWLMRRKRTDAGTVQQCIVHPRGAKSATSVPDDDTLLILVFLFPPPSRFKNNQMDGKHGNRLPLISDHFCPLSTQHAACVSTCYKCTHTETHTHSTMASLLWCNISISIAKQCVSTSLHSPD